MQIDRLLKIVLLLLKKEHITARELALEFKVTSRTIYRDIDTLSAAGIPVYSSKGNGGGISLLDNYKLDSYFLTEKEQKNILFALQSLEATSYPNLDMTLTKLKEVFNKPLSKPWIEVDFSYWGSPPDENEKFQVFKEAILGQSLIRFDYYNITGEKAKRLVEPIKLLYKSSSWYLQAYCRQKEDYRVFRISRIQNLTLTKEYFELRVLEESSLTKTKDIQDNENFETVTLHLRFSSDIAYRVYDDFNTGNITYNKDHTFDVSIDYPLDNWLISYLLSSGDQVQVISPVFIKDLLIKKAQAVIETYNTTPHI